ncbi:MAG: hypothetical protein HC888_19715 [Candidatus Competibacteraceae bacterium]|nr:hypothetical protein [Candidatus Competibacteraceae bacterium]
MARTAFYSRSGDYSRLQILNAGDHDSLLGTCPNTSGTMRCAYLELADGTIRRFEERANWQDSGLNKDRWRLREIRDRGNGDSNYNSISISYYSNRWEIQDRYARIQKIFWETDPSVDSRPAGTTGE